MLEIHWLKYNNCGLKFFCHALLIAVSIPLISGVINWTAETRARSKLNRPLEYDEHYRISVSHNQQIINSTLGQSGHYRDITITVIAFRETFLLDLHLNLYLFSSNYIERSITDSGVVYHETNHTESHCYYIGKVRNRLKSTAAVSTCRGIVAYFAIGNISYHIEPLSNHLSGRHKVYKGDDTNFKYRCGGDHSILSKLQISEWPDRRLKRSFNWPQDKDKQDRVVELYIANSYSQYVARGNDANAVIQRAKDIVNVASSLYQPVDVYLVLVGMEVWTNSDQITLNMSDSSTTLNTWYTYRMTQITPIHYNDNAHLISNDVFDGGVVGKADVGTMCSDEYSGAIVSDVNPSASLAGSTMAHEMGHNFGLVHDTDACVCNDPAGHCIMYPEYIATEPYTVWSQCSLSQLATAFRTGLDICLYDVPQIIFQPSSFCGNGIVEDGEQCDCGKAPQQECSSTCCNSTTCLLNTGAACAYGRCCDTSTCKISPAATVCRAKADDCDLSEFCDGKAYLCPSDTHKPDGTNCTVNGDYANCYNGLCRTHKWECELLWGSGTIVSDDICYTSFNVDGTYYGNCGMNWLPNVTYIPCQTSDAMCGKLQCEDFTKTLSTYATYYLIATASIGSSQCHSVAIDFGLHVQDPGLVPNGANCGDGKMCISQKCMNVNSLPTPSCASSCQQNEMCNNVGFCQSLTGPSQPSNVNTGLVIGLCILFLLILPLLILGVVIAFKYPDRLRSSMRSIKTGRFYRPNTRTKTPADTHTSTDTYNVSALEPSVETRPSRQAPPRPRTGPGVTKNGNLTPVSSATSWHTFGNVAIVGNGRRTETESDSENLKNPSVEQLKGKLFGNGQMTHQNILPPPPPPPVPVKPIGNKAIPQVGPKPPIPPKRPDLGNAAPY